MNNRIYDPNDPTNYWVLEANNRARTAEFHENRAREELSAERFNNRSNLDLISKLRRRVEVEVQRSNELTQMVNKLAQRVNELENDNLKLKSEKQFFVNLLVESTLSQRVWAETAVQIGVEAAGKTTEEIVGMQKENIDLVLANKSKYTIQYRGAVLELVRLVNLLKHGNDKDVTIEEINKLAEQAAAKMSA
jgi:transcriptional regulator